jgi:hypothetical protein
MIKRLYTVVQIKENFMEMEDIIGVYAITARTRFDAAIKSTDITPELFSSAVKNYMPKSERSNRMIFWASYKGAVYDSDDTVKFVVFEGNPIQVYNTMIVFLRKEFENIGTENIERFGRQYLEILAKDPKWANRIGDNTEMVASLI